MYICLITNLDFNEPPYLGLLRTAFWPRDHALVNTELMTLLGYLKPFAIGPYYSMHYAARLNKYWRRISNSCSRERASLHTSLHCT